jgi:hypothetical protein
MIRENSYIWQINNALNEAISQRATKQSQRSTKKNSYLNKYSFFVALGASFEKLCDTTLVKIKNFIAISQRNTMSRWLSGTQRSTKKNSYLNTYSYFVALGASFEQFCDITIKYSIIKINAI